MQKEFVIPMDERKTDIYMSMKPLCLLRRVQYFMKLAWKYHQIQSTRIYLVHGLDISADRNISQSPLTEKVFLIDVLSR